MTFRHVFPVQVMPLISIHTLRVEGDGAGGGRLCYQSGISIHTLRVEGDPPVEAHEPVVPISIHTLRVEGDAETEMRAAWLPDISIHTLRVEGDRFLGLFFGPPSSISIHTLRVEGDSGASTITSSWTLFQSTPSAWRVTVPEKFHLVGRANISIHTLRVEGDRKSGK